MQPKDYEDLVYYIERIAGLKHIEDEEKFNRIVKRTEMIEQNDGDGPYYTLTKFSGALYMFAASIVKIEEYIKKGPSALALYPELVKERLNSIFLMIALDFSETPGGRYKDAGPFSAEEFRDSFLEPKYLEALANNKKLTIFFDGGYGYSAGFLEETFGGLIRKGYNAEDILNNIIFISQQEPKIIEEISTYMIEAQSFSRERK